PGGRRAAVAPVPAATVWEPEAAPARRPSTREESVMSSPTPSAAGRGATAAVQRVGGYLAAMVMPNIGAFIAWGLITALFIPTGWWPNPFLAQLVDPMITVLLPVLIGYTGGRLVHGQRGAVVAAVATLGITVGAGMP